MKSNLFKISFLCFIMFVASCSPKLYYPPNTQPFYETTFLDVTYIENLDVLDFILFLKLDADSKEVKDRIMPQMAQNRKGNLDIKWMYYPQYRKVPAIVSPEFAQEFCNWRGEVVTFRKNNVKGPLPRSFKKLVEYNQNFKEKVVFEIPTESDLSLAETSNFPIVKYDSSILKFPVLSQEKLSEKGYFHFRCVAKIVKKE
jgi:hypothetical protein